MARSFHPTALEISIGGYMGPSYRLKWNGDHLVYRAFEDQMKPNAEFCLTPSKRQWEAFWKKLDTIGVWDWRDHYEPSGPITDGTGWSIKIHKDNQLIESGGDNAYPVDGSCAGCNGLTSEFTQFLNAVRRLMGYIPFE